MSIRYKFTK